MGITRQRVREIVGFTFDGTRNDAPNWETRARAFKLAAVRLAENHDSSPPIPYYFNAALSLELLLKAISVARGQQPEHTHDLNKLCKQLKLPISNDHECTLELLSELLIWSARYPIPKHESKWDRYFDSVLEKHVVRQHSGNVGSTMIHRERFPTRENYLALWQQFEKAYEAAMASVA